MGERSLFDDNETIHSSDIYRPSIQITKLMIMASRKARGDHAELARALGKKKNDVKRWYTGHEISQKNLLLVENYVWGPR